MSDGTISNTYVYYFSRKNREALAREQRAAERLLIEKAYRDAVWFASVIGVEVHRG